MAALPRKQASVKPAPRPKRAPKAPAAVALPGKVLDAIVKVAAATFMSDLADAAEESKTQKA